MHVLGKCQLNLFVFKVHQKNSGILQLPKIWVSNLIFFEVNPD